MVSTAIEKMENGWWRPHPLPTVNATEDGKEAKAVTERDILH